MQASYVSFQNSELLSQATSVVRSSVYFKNNPELSTLAVTGEGNLFKRAPLENQLTERESIKLQLERLSQVQNDNNTLKKSLRSDPTQVSLCLSEERAESVSSLRESDWM